MNDFLDRSGPDLAIGIDLGGTNLRAALYRDLGGEPGGRIPTPLAERRAPIGAARDPATIVERVASVVAALVDQAGLGAGTVPVGLGFAGMLSGDAGHVTNSPHLGWRGVPFGELLRARLGPRHPVRVENDVNAITWGELVLGAGRGARDILAVFVGTGIGAGYVANGQLVRGASGCAAELGHVKVVWDERARPCECGLKGCVEAYLGGEYLRRRARAELGGGARSAAVRLAGGAEHVHPGHLDAAAADGDDYALALWCELGPLLGVVLANAVTLLNPERLILGGGVLGRTPVLREHVIAAFEVAVNPPALAGLTLELAGLGDDAGLVGSALLARDLR